MEACSITHLLVSASGLCLLHRVEKADISPPLPAAGPCAQRRKRRGGQWGTGRCLIPRGPVHTKESPLLSVFITLLWPPQYPQPQVNQQHPTNYAFHIQHTTTPPFPSFLLSSTFQFYSVPLYLPQAPFSSSSCCSALFQCLLSLLTLPSSLFLTRSPAALVSPSLTALMYLSRKWKGPTWGHRRRIEGSKQFRRGLQALWRV